MQPLPYISEVPSYDSLMAMGRPTKAPRTAFGERLVHARQEAGLTQQQLADKLGTSQRVIAHWERSRVELRAEHLAALADILGVTTDFLLGREHQKRRGNGPMGRVRRVLEGVSRLPRHRQQKIIEVVEAMMAHGEERP
jgi:transcriptional regulator with XRE-family HTH domain